MDVTEDTDERDEVDDSDVADTEDDNEPSEDGVETVECTGSGWIDPAGEGALRGSASSVDSCNRSFGIVPNKVRCSGVR